MIRFIKKWWDKFQDWMGSEEDDDEEEISIEDLVPPDSGLKRVLWNLADAFERWAKSKRRSPFLVEFVIQSFMSALLMVVASMIVLLCFGVYFLFAGSIDKDFLLVMLIVSTAITRNCFSTGNIPFVSSSGGLVGYSEKIENCYTLSNNDNGLTIKGDVVSSYFNKYIVIAAAASKPEGRSTAELQTQATYIGWDFTDVWEMTEGGYPTLRGVEKPPLLLSQAVEMKQKSTVRL